MVRHVILWTLKDSLSADEKESVKIAAKEQLEGLLGKVPSLRSISVSISPLPTSNCDIMLDAFFDNAQGLSEYSLHPLHVEVANTYVRPYTASRVCFDFKA